MLLAATIKIIPSLYLLNYSGIIDYELFKDQITESDYSKKGHFQRLKGFILIVFMGTLMEYFIFTRVAAVYLMPKI